MIAKEIDYQRIIGALKTHLDTGYMSDRERKDLKNWIAGLRAEKDMQYALARRFAERDKYRVFNNLKIDRNGITAQVDHLVVTRASLYFIESKSVAGAISVNERGEWSRWYGKKGFPIDSPVEQSAAHAGVLLDVLAANVDRFMGKLLGKIQAQIGSLSIYHLVSISKDGRITGKGLDALGEGFWVKKYDQVPRAIYDHHQENFSLLKRTLSFKDESFETMNEAELDRLTDYLLELDQSESEDEMIARLTKQAASAVVQEAAVSVASANICTEPHANVASAPLAQPQTSHTAMRVPDIGWACRKCGSGNLEVRNGRYGYFFKCLDCTGNTPIKEFCAGCDKQVRVRKSGDDFYLGCEGCGGESLFFRNHSSCSESAQQVAPAAATTNSQAAATNLGICIRCRADIPLDLAAPHCPNCYASWSRYKNETYSEKYCHTCGQQHHTSKAKPQCLVCFKNGVRT